MSRDPGFDRLLQQLAPGGRLCSVRRLRGGLGAMMHVLDIERADGTRTKLTLRRFISAFRDASPEYMTGEYQRLLLVEKAGIPAPQALLLDAEGEYFGVPAIVLTYIPGASRYLPANRAVWTADLAAAAARIHAVTPQEFDLSLLKTFQKEEIRAELAGHCEEASEAGDSFLQEVYDALLANLDRIDWPPLCLTHDDFWPGNTVWYRGRLKAVIDWGDAQLGDRRTDVAQCQLELSFTLDVETGDQFVSAYEGLAGPLPQLWYFVLFRGLFALLYIEKWLVGYADAGLELEAGEVRTKLKTFIRRALDEASEYADT